MMGECLLYPGMGFSVFFIFFVSKVPHMSQESERLKSSSQSALGIPEGDASQDSLRSNERAELERKR